MDVSAKYSNVCDKDAVVDYRYVIDILFIFDNTLIISLIFTRMTDVYKMQRVISH